MLLLTCPESSECFTYIPDSKKLVAEYSTLRYGFRPLYDDAADAGIVLMNNKTGNLTSWYLSNETRDNEGEIVAWHLNPTTDSLRRNDRMEGYTMDIYND